MRCDWIRRGHCHFRRLEYTPSVPQNTAALRIADSSIRNAVRHGNECILFRKKRSARVCISPNPMRMMNMGVAGERGEDHVHWSGASFPMHPDLPDVTG